MKLQTMIEQTEFIIEYAHLEDFIKIQVRLQDFTSYYSLVARTVKGEFSPENKTLFLYPETTMPYLHGQIRCDKTRPTIDFVAKLGFMTTINDFHYVIGKYNKDQ